MPFIISSTEFLDALNGKKINDASSPEISMMLVKVFMLIGLRPAHYPTKEEQIFIESYIRKNYFNKTIQEILFAFDLYIQNKFELNYEKVYDQFQISLFVQVMNAYKNWIRANYEPKIEPKKEIMYELSQDHKRAEILEFIENKNVNLFLIPVYIYEWMVELDFINLTKEQKQELFKKAKEIYKQRLLSEMTSIRRYEFSESDKNNIRNLAKRIAVHNYIKSKK